MRVFFLFLLTTLSTVLLPLSATAKTGMQPPPDSPQFQEAAPDSPPPVRAADYLGYDVAIVLGIVEGITEFLPVSSTGHMVLVNEILGLNNDVPVVGRDGQPLTVKEKEALPVRLAKKLRGEPKEEPRLAPFTLKNAADAYIIVIQFGAILAVLLVYWKRVRWLLRGLLAGNAACFRLTLYLVLAFLPAAVLGLLLNRIIEEVLFGVLPVIAALFIGAIVMLGVEYWHRAKRRRERREGGDKLGRKTGPDLPHMGAGRALVIGIAQCVALCPGTSRSMATICGGYLVGLSPARATEFSFLLGLVTLTCATLYKTATSGQNMLAAFHPGPLALGLVMAAITAFFAVKWMIDWINVRGLAAFAWYRIAFSVALFIVFFVVPNINL